MAARVEVRRGRREEGAKADTETDPRMKRALTARMVEADTIVLGFALFWRTGDAPQQNTICKRRTRIVTRKRQRSTFPTAYAWIISLPFHKKKGKL
eukprot:1378110-Rhodomonas_salina.1